MQDLTSLPAVSDKRTTIGQPANESSEEEESQESDSVETSSSQEEDFGTRPKVVMRGPTRAQLSARQFLSKKLPTITGRLEEWLMLISAYKTSTTACGFSNVLNVAQLQECLEGQALNTVRSRLLLPSAMPLIIKTLRML